LSGIMGNSLVSSSRRVPAAFDASARRRGRGTLTLYYSLLLGRGVPRVWRGAPVPGGT